METAKLAAAALAALALIAVYVRVTWRGDDQPGDAGWAATQVGAVACLALAVALVVRELSG